MGSPRYRYAVHFRAVNKHGGVFQGYNLARARLVGLVSTVYWLLRAGFRPLSITFEKIEYPSDYARRKWEGES